MAKSMNFLEMQADALDWYIDGVDPLNLYMSHGVSFAPAFLPRAAFTCNDIVKHIAEGKRVYGFTDDDLVRRSGIDRDAAFRVIREGHGDLCDVIDVMEAANIHPVSLPPMSDLEGAGA